MLTSGARPSTDERAKRTSGSSADSIFNAAFELVATPALFAFFGYLLDGKLHTGRLFTFLFAGVVAVYEIWKLWYGYNHRIDELHAQMLRPRSESPKSDLPKTAEPGTAPAATGDES